MNSDSDSAIYENKKVNDLVSFPNAIFNKNVQETIRLHDNQPKEKHSSSGNYLKSTIYGGLDGAITSMTLIISCAYDPSAVKALAVMAISVIVSDAVGMALGDYLSTKSRQEYIQAEKSRERWEVENDPVGEKQEIIEIYTKKGFKDEDAKLMAETLSRHKEVWVDIMMREELGIVDEEENAVYHALVTFFAFAGFGLAPVVPQISERILNIDIQTTAASLVIGVFVLFSLGAIKTKITMRKWWISGVEVIIIGILATSTAFGLSYVCHKLYGI